MSEAFQPVHDHDLLFLAYCYVRAVYASVSRLRQVDATIRDVATQLDEMASHIHTEIDAAQGNLPLPRRA